MASTLAVYDQVTSDQKDWDADGEGEEVDEENEDDYDDEDFDAEAEDIAKRLGDQLWADIAKAQAEVHAATASTIPSPTTTSRTTPSNHPPNAVAHSSHPPADTHISHQQADSSPPPFHNRKQEAALITVRTILSFAFKDPVVRATLASYAIPRTSSSVLDVLAQCASTGSILKGISKPLSEAVVSLAKSDVLFSSMRYSDAPSIQLDKGKRKRDHTDVDLAEDRYQKRPAFEYPDIVAQVTQAVRFTLSAFSSHPSWANSTPDPSLISSIQFPLHQAYLFSVTSAPRARPEQMQMLQELGALIQMLGVLSKIHIGPAPTPWDSTEASATSAPDIGTAVYPCMVPGCTKTFHRLYSLRNHSRLHALVDRPYKCSSCPASFQRNHDLKRHVKLHDKTAWKCLGCDKVFSRRDAIKRHKDSRSKGGKGHADSACANAGIEQVEVEKDEDEEDVTRRAKLWNGIVATQIANASAAAASAAGIEGQPMVQIENPGGSGDDARVLEEGEIPQQVIEHAQSTVLQLYPVIKGRIGPPGSLHTQVAPTTSAIHPTLASVIARTQPQYHPPPEALGMDAPTAAVSLNGASGTQNPEEAPISLSWLSEEQTRLLEEAIAQAASAAQAQAEAEAALEEDSEDSRDEDDEEGDVNATTI